MRPFLQVLSASSRAVGIWLPGLVAAYGELDMLDEARLGFDELAADNFSALPRDAVWPLALAFLSDACVKLNDRIAAKVLLDQLSPFAGLVLTAGYTTSAGPADRCRAAMAELCGRHDVADKHILKAAELAESSGSPVWMAHVEHTWAWMAAQRGNMEGVATHFARARSLADEFDIGAIPVDPPQQTLRDHGAETPPHRSTTRWSVGP